ncbi:MAG: hypothetical protein NTV58_05105 [Deltaproteobacteria bacterium]|nr:hypothetical protein [Deltaproteobacteria bacterium]
MLTGAPLDDSDHYLLSHAGDIKLFYPAKLRPKPDADRIRIRLRSFLFMKWLELAGARAIVSAPAEHPMPENTPVSPFQKEE